jgi:hypothetical protein
MSDTYTRKGVIIVSVSDGIRVALSLRGLSWPSGARAMASHRFWTDLCRGDVRAHARPEGERSVYDSRGDSGSRCPGGDSHNNSRGRPGASAGRHRDSSAGSARLRGHPRNAGLLRAPHARERLLLWPSVLGVPRWRVVSRAELERTMGGRRTRARSSPDPSSAGPLLPSTSCRVEGMASRCATALGGALRARVARRGPRTGLARTRGSLGATRR